MKNRFSEVNICIVKSMLTGFISISTIENFLYQDFGNLIENKCYKESKFGNW